MKGVRVVTSSSAWTDEEVNTIIADYHRVKAHEERMKQISSTNPWIRGEETIQQTFSNPWKSATRAYR